MARVTVADVQRLVGRKFRVSERDMTLSPTRQYRPARARHVAMLLARRFTKASLAVMGRRFNLDHTSIVHGVQTAQKRCAADQVLAGIVAGLQWELYAMSYANAAG